ncbi:hypothetical protein SAMN06264365_106158 [Actinoplanes regularis]|uniref:Uncharacterized protein n=1 Tax=Actinoplanes regularis TaxID=52697 RepID=A0A238ZMD8_9ACTN|nr:hypothetical protein SAMN06264365_106158 [Actinoplanes regularis]
MTTGDSARSREDTVRRVLFTVGALVVAAAMAATIFAPLILSRFHPTGEDRLGSGGLGQTYGVVAAVASTLALGGVLIGLAMQYRQYTDARLQKLEDSTEELVRLALTDPFYRQCWGGWSAPDGLDERLFLYCTRVLKTWRRAWVMNELTEDQIRSRLAVFFDSEIPRLFWRSHGDLDLQTSSSNRHERFRVMVNEEYLRAEKAGPPSRRHDSRGRRTPITEMNINGHRATP